MVVLGLKYNIHPHDHNFSNNDHYNIYSLVSIADDILTTNIACLILGFKYILFHVTIFFLTFTVNLSAEPIQELTNVLKCKVFML